MFKYILAQSYREKNIGQIQVLQNTWVSNLENYQVTKAKESLRNCGNHEEAK